MTDPASTDASGAPARATKRTWRAALPQVQGTVLATTPAPLEAAAAGESPLRPLAFNDGPSDDAPVCDPNDPDCQVP